MNQIYCFSLYCEGHGLTKSQAFVSIRQSEEDARLAAKRDILRQFPLDKGWVNHEISMIAISKDIIIGLAKEYQNGEN